MNNCAKPVQNCVVCRSSVLLKKVNNKFILNVEGLDGTPIGINENDVILDAALVVEGISYPAGTSLKTILLALVNGSGSGSGSIVRYKLDFGVSSSAIITATGLGVTVAKNSAALWEVNVPSGIELLSIDFSTIAPTESTPDDLSIDFLTSSTIYNQGVTNRLVPVVTGFDYQTVPSAPVALSYFVTNPGTGDIGLRIADYNPTFGTARHTFKVSF